MRNLVFPKTWSNIIPDAECDCWNGGIELMQTPCSAHIKEIQVGCMHVGTADCLKWLYFSLMIIGFWLWVQEGQNIILESPASVTCPKCNRRGTLHHSYFVYWATHRYFLEDYQLLFWVWSHVHSIWGIKDWCFPNLQTWYQNAPLIVVVWSVGMWVPPRCGMGWLWFQSHCESWHGIQFNTVQFNLDFDCTLVSR